MAQRDINLDVGLNIPDSEIKALSDKLKQVSKSMNISMAIGRDIGIVGDHDELKLNKILNNLSTYTPFLGKAKGYVNSQFLGSSPANLGQYSASRRMLGRLSSAALSAYTETNAALVNEKDRKDAYSAFVELENVRQQLNMANNSARNAQRYSYNKKYLNSATDVARRFLNGESNIGSVDERIVDNLTNYNSILETLKQTRREIKAGSMSDEEEKKALKDLSGSAKALVSASKFLGTNMMSNAKEIKRQTDVFIEEQNKSIADRMNAAKIKQEEAELRAGIISQRKSAIGRLRLEQVYGRSMPADVADRMRAFYKAQDVEKRNNQKMTSGYLKEYIDTNIVGGGMPESVRKQYQQFYKAQNAEGKNNAIALLSKAPLALIGAKLAKDALDYGVAQQVSKMGESITRSVYGSRAAKAERYAQRAPLVGSTSGAAIGALVGGLLAGGLSFGTFSWAGASAGAAFGGALGGAGGTLLGEQEKIKLKANEVSANYMAKRLRAKSLFGSSYNTFFADQITNAGLGNGGDAMAALADKSMSMRGRMMLGQVGEQEMLYMSMMPNYYAALMAGVTGPELSTIFAKDLQNINDPSLRYVVGNALGGSEAFAITNNPSFGANYNKWYNQAARAEASAMQLEYGYAMTGAERARRDTRKNIHEIRKTAKIGDADYFGSEYCWTKYEEGNPWGRFWGHLGSDSGFARSHSLHPINIYFQVDGQTVAQATANAADLKQDTIYLQNGFVGG